jgi:hypothetical protein
MLPWREFGTEDGAAEAVAGIFLLMWPVSASMLRPGGSGAEEEDTIVVCM